VHKNTLGKYALLFLFLSLILAACSNREQAKSHLTDMYIHSLSKMLELHPSALNNASYLSIDMSAITALNKTEKQQVILYFSKTYHLPIYTKKLSELSSPQFRNPQTQELTGVLLKLENSQFHLFRQVSVSTSFYQSNNHRFGTITTFNYSSHNWYVDSFRQTWTS